MLVQAKRELRNPDKKFLIINSSQVNGIGNQRYDSREGSFDDPEPLQPLISKQG